MNNKTILYILLVLTFVNSGLSMLSGFISAAFLPVMEAYYTQGLLQIPTQLSVAMENFFNTPRLYYLSFGILNALSLIGAILMWKPRSVGFHCYTIAQLLLLIVPVLFLGRGYLGIGNILFTLLFVAAYYFLLRSLGAFSHPTDSNDTTDDTTNFIKQ